MGGIEIHNGTEKKHEWWREIHPLHRKYMGGRDKYTPCTEIMWVVARNTLSVQKIRGL
jgi:hypothetical protein